jgi:hypothetical protein
MENVDNTDQKKKSPFKFVLPIFILLIIGVIGFGIYEYFRIAPRDVRFTNVTSSSVTVSWNTKSPTSATALVFEGDTFLPLTILGLGGERFYDTRDVRVAELNSAAEVGINKDGFSLTMNDFQTQIVVEDMGEYYTHHVTFTGLDSEKAYSFMVGDWLLFRKVRALDGEQVVQTLVLPTSVETPSPAYGSIKDANWMDEDINVLRPVTDGVIYFTYLDDSTGRRSNTMSSVLNNEGNWYLDTSLARDDEGNPFMRTYDTIAGNISVELLIDTGPLGQWKKKENAYVLSPASTTVVNMADSVGGYGLEGSVIPLDSSRFEEEVKGVLVAQSSVGQEICEMNGLGTWSGGSCRCVPGASFNSSRGLCSCNTGFFQSGDSCVQSTAKEGELPNCSCGCPPGFSLTKPSGEYTQTTATCSTVNCNAVTPPACYGPKTVEKCVFKEYCPADVNSCVQVYTDGTHGGLCRCPQSVLEKRNCIASGKVPETLPCAGGLLQGDAAYDGTKCMKCHYRTTSTGSYIGVFVDGSKEFEYKDGNCVPIVAPPECGLAQGKVYESWQATIVTKDLCGNGSTASPSTVTFDQNSNNITWICENSAGERVCNASRKVDNDERGCVLSGGTWLSLSQVCFCESINNLVRHESGKICSCKEGDYTYNQNLGACVLTNNNCNAGDQKSENGETLVCSIEGRYEVLAKECKREEKRIYKWDGSGKCSPSYECESADNCPAPRIDCENYVYDPVRDKCVKPELIVPVNPWVDSVTIEEQPCWESGGSTSLFQYVNGKVYKCQGGEWKAVSNPTSNAKQCLEFLIGMGNSCYEGGGNKYCHDGRFGNTYYCHYGSWKLLEFYPIDDVIATKVYPTGSGSQCRRPEGEVSQFHIKCYCEDGPDKGKTIDEGDWCRETSLLALCSLDAHNRVCKDKEAGLVCSTDGITCVYRDGPCVLEKDYHCSGQPKSANLIGDQPWEFAFNDIVGEVLGQENTSSYVFDKETGMFTVIDVGTYMFEYEGVYYSFSVEPGIVEEEGDGILIYIDRNNNGKYDSGEVKVSDLAGQVEIIQTERNYEYSLKKGFNLVSTPYLPAYDEIKTAAGLLSKLNEVYGDVLYSISQFDGQWKIVGQNVKVYDNNDFQLLPGEGYLIKSKEDIDIVIKGQPVKYETPEDTAPITLFEGWNLIGLYGTGVKTYTAKTMIADINASNFTADNVSKWEKEKQSYEGFQFSEGQEYGFDFPINSLESVFVRVLEGRGNWQPKLRSQ